jgi:hypothetical protein
LKMKLKYTGQAAAPVTFAGKFTVAPGDVIDTEEPDTNILLQSGFFQAVDGDSSSSSSDDDDGGGGKGKSSKKSSDDDNGKGSKK